MRALAGNSTPILNPDISVTCDLLLKGQNLPLRTKFFLEYGLGIHKGKRQWELSHWSNDINLNMLRVLVLNSSWKTLTYYVFCVTVKMTQVSVFRSDRDDRKFYLCVRLQTVSIARPIFRNSNVMFTYKFSITIIVQKQIFWFEISVHNTLIMEVGESFKYTGSVETRSRIIK